MSQKFGDYDYSDLEPLPLDSPETDDIILCRIMYSEEYKTLMSYMRALMAKNELSERALYMTELVIGKVAAHYTVWEYRYKIVKELAGEGAADNAAENAADNAPDGLQDSQGPGVSPSTILQRELSWCGRIALENEKNYQIWHYRQLIIGLMIDLLYGGDSSSYDIEKEEYPIISKMIKDDEKNYHVWSHRRWLVETFKLHSSKEELRFTEELLIQDVRNNSAWNHRFFVIFGGKTMNRDLDEEIEFVKLQIEKSPTNPSSWNYLRGIYKKMGLNIGELKGFVDKFIGKEKEKEDNLSVQAFELLGEIYEIENEKRKAGEVYELLGKKLDVIRVNYWEQRRLLAESN
ncbi:DEKNAAC105411 [Brettanomyces naardenensis]|uniref:Protein farnesyltransferase/geranylgeranyltransferase type-1 subunit alpha n=1 Tax=Brettanomyces naardenensis TaxID=13370 RepID=A0A448YTJ7_BRENA|nr:DEKNAAC105411 [Brettanomyces naardenensis]